MRWELCVFAILLWQFPGGECLRLTSPNEDDPVILALILDRVNLSCTLVDDEGTDHPIAWYYNNVPRVSSGGNLLLDRVSITDGGWYTCAASTDNERYELDFLLVVGEEPRVSTNLPNGPYEVRRERVEFPCFPEGTPQPSVRWSYQDTTGSVFDIVDGDEEGRYRIDPTTQSLIIFNATKELIERPFRCDANNTFDTFSRTYDGAIITETPLLSPTFPFNDTTTLLVTVDQNTDDVMLNCTTGSDGNTYDYEWFRNGEMLMETTNSLLITRNELSSSFYCCEISFNSTINLYCTTVVFYSKPVLTQPTLPPSSQFYLSSGRKAGLLCHGSTDITSMPATLHYDPPIVTWAGPENTQEYVMNDTDGRSLAYRLVEVNPKTSGLHTCSGNNFVNTVSQDVVLKYIDIGNESSNVLMNGRAESKDFWTLSDDNANITTYMNENVFMLTFSDTDSIEDIWLSQNITLSQNTSTISISGRLRQSDGSNNSQGVYPVIQVLHFNGTPAIELQHPVKRSKAWQWVQKSLLTNGTTTFTIRLALKTDRFATSRRPGRQSSTTRNVFFDDVSVSPTDITDDDGDGSDQTLVYIVSGIGGGIILSLLVALVFVLICCFCCRKGKNNARPMRKITLLVKKASKRYSSPLKSSKKRLQSPIPAEYEIPTNSQPEYTTLKTGTTKQEKYTPLNPQSLNEPTYYTSTHTGSPFKKESPGRKRAEEEADEGGVTMYLEVVPSVPAHSSRSSSPRGNSPLGITGLASPENRHNTDSEIASPDVLDGDVVDPMYEYVNADLGPI
jgi:hypothetical protein